MPPLKVIITIVSLFLMRSTQYDIDFGTSCANCDWFVVLDGVMGGLSEATITETSESIIFKGQISLENNGGFASYRSPYGSYDLSWCKKVTIRYRSTGQDFGLTLHKYRKFWLPNYKVNLPITKGEWKTITMNLSDFGIYRLGKEIGGHPDVDDLSKIIRFGLISNTKKATSFEIEVDMIRFE